LWVEHFITTEVLQGSVIRIDPISQRGAFTDSTQCDLAAQDEALKSNMRMSSERRKIVKRLEYGLWRSLIMSADQPDFTDYRCLPDTVDPRGAKGSDCASRTATRRFDGSVWRVSGGAHGKSECRT